MCPWFESRWYHDPRQADSGPLVAFWAIMSGQDLFPEHIHLDARFEALRTWLDEHRPPSIVVITDRNTEKHCLPLLAPHLPPGTQFLALSSHGEAIKTLPFAHGVWDSLEGMGMDRHGLVIGLGGGTVTDLVAFTADTYMRGVHCWLIPTTVLGMVDASVGGKTGINLNHLKNRIGTFHTPDGISINPEFLSTLDDRERRNGWAEHFKHHLITSDAPLEMTGGLIDGTASGEEVMKALAYSVRSKWDVVTQDPTESTGWRKILNFGHTGGHALEGWALENGVDIKHGEAVAWGMRLALNLSILHPECPGADEAAFAPLLEFFERAFPLPGAMPDKEELWARMQTDKKNLGGRLRFVLLDGVGQPKPDLEVSRELVDSALGRMTHP